jgi:lipopolysaccharide biosynthesis glycosyltransferase
MNAHVIQETTSFDMPVVVCAVDNNYAMPMAVMLRSMAENLRSYAHISVWILDGGISRRNRRRIQASVPEGVVEFHWIRPSPRELKGFPVSGHVSICAYFRLLMADILPTTIHKAIYLDVDILVLGDIGELWNMDPGEHSILAFAERGRIVSEPFALSMYEELGLSPDAPYFNSGVLVVNLALWRRENLFREFTIFVDKYAKLLNFWDQDVLNGVLACSWGPLDKRWNYQVHHLWEGDVSNLGQNQTVASVLHFASAIKPWSFRINHPARGLFLQWVDLTAWAGWRPESPLINWRAVKVAVKNKYWYGRKIRRIPVIGQMWGILRNWQKQK